jgi:chitodextrinase
MSYAINSSVIDRRRAEFISHTSMTSDFVLVLRVPQLAGYTTTEWSMRGLVLGSAAAALILINAIAAIAQPQAAVIDQPVTVQNGWGGNLAFSTTTLDTSGFWNSGNPARLTVPAGINYVRLTASIDLAYTCTVCEIWIVQNDAAVIAASYGATANTGFGGTTFTAIAPVVRVTEGDFFTVRTYQNSGGPLPAAIHVGVVALDTGAAALATTLKTAAIAETVSIPDGWTGNLSFTSPAFDTGGFWNAGAASRLTVPAGVNYVQVAASVSLSYTCTICEIYVLKNDYSIVGVSYGATANTGFGGATFSAIAPVVQVGPGDYFTVRMFQNTGGATLAPISFSIVALDSGATSSTSLKLAAISQSVSVPNGWGAALAFSSNVVDTGGFWNASLPARLTMPAPGYVQVAASVSFDYRCTVCEVYLLKNGSVVARSYGSTANTGFGDATFTAVAPINRADAGDYFTVAAYQDTGQTVSAAVNFSVVAVDSQVQANWVPYIDHITVTPSVSSLPLHGTQTLTAQAFNADNQPLSGIAFVWSTSNARVAITNTTSTTATLRGDSPGEAAITARSVNYPAGGTATIIVVPGSNLTAPTNLSATPSMTDVTLSWSASSGAVAVAGYRIFRSSVAVGTTPTLSYQDGNLTPNTMYQYSVSAFDAAGNESARSSPVTVTTLSAPPTPVYPLKPSSNNRYLVDQNNVPFLMIGDSPQSLMGTISEAEAQFYFADRQAAGFNAAWISLICDGYNGCNDDGTTYDHIQPFTTPGDLSTPNETYFAHADAIVRLAGQYGITVLLDPIETGGWLGVLRNNGVAKARAYGQYVGNRYKRFDNIIWFNGNDFQTWRNPDDDALVQAVALGIKDADARHVHTVELEFFVSGSLDDPAWAPIIGLDAAYTYYPTYAQVLTEYNRSSFKPVFMVEANYEFERDYIGPSTLRRQEYWTALSGATGQLYGNYYTWPFRAGWQNSFDTPGVTQLGFLKALLSQRRWYDLVPDQDHSVVTAGYGTYRASGGDVNTDTYATTARVPDGTLVMTYVPTSRTITVDMTRLAGLTIARWFDPSAGTFVTIAGSPFANAGARTFTPPGNNADGDGDWVLVLEAPLTPDTQPPTVPAGLSVTAVRPAQIDLSWNDSTDNVAVAGYQIYRGGILIGTSSGHVFTDSGLSPLTTYSYRVAAYDGAGNVSALSSSASATTLAPDTTPPTIPAGLTASNIAARAVTISWTASTDAGSGVAAYRIYRNGVQVGSVTTASFNDSGLSPATSYSYTVAADDLAGNRSAQSPALAITTLAAAAIPAFVQQSSSVPQSPESQVVVTFTAAQSAGNTNVLVIGWSDTTASITSVSDSNGNAYETGIATFRGAGMSQAIYFAPNIKAAAAGGNIVTVAFSQAANFADIRALEYSGLDPVSPFDRGVSASGSGTAASSGPIATSFAATVILGAGVTSNRFSAAGSGFTSRVITSPDGDIVEDQIVSATGSYAATATLNTGSWLMQAAAFRAAGQ